MNPIRRREAITTLTALAATGLSPNAWAAYPDRPLRIVIPTPAGFVDTFARLMAQKMSDSMGQAVVVDQKPGGDGQIAAADVLRAEKDGHTLLVIHIGTHAINPHLRPKLSYNPETDFAPLTQLLELPNLLVSTPSKGFKTVADLIAAAKAHPGSLFYGSPGNGSTGHLAGAMFCERAGIQAEHVPYKGSSPAMIDLISGRIHFMFDSLAGGAQQVKSGKLNGLAVTSAKRSPQFPEYPTMIESGFPDWVTGPWFGLAVRTGTPPDIVKRLEAEAIKAITHPEVKQKLSDMGSIVIGSTADTFAAFIRKESEHWGSVVRKYNIKPD